MVSLPGSQRPPSPGSSSIGQLLALQVGRKRGYSDGSTAFASVTQQCCVASLVAQLSSKGLHAVVSSLTSPGAVSPQSTAVRTVGLPSNPYLQLPAIVCTRGPASLSRVWRLLHGLSMQISPHSDHHRSAASLSNSLRCLCPAPNYCSYVRISPPLQFLHPLGAGPVLLSPSFSLPPFILPIFVWIYMFLSGG